MTKAQKFIELYYVVEGSSELPLDMLRYDRSFPASETDARRAQNFVCKRRVALCARNRNGDINAARWRSFGWVVIDVTGPDDRRACELADEGWAKS